MLINEIKMLRIRYAIVYCVWFCDFYGYTIRKVVGDGYYGMGSNSIEQIKELDDRVCELDKKIAQQDTAFSDMKAKISDQNTAIAHQDTRFAEMNTYIAQQNTKIAEMKLLINGWGIKKQIPAGQQISSGYQQISSGYQQSGTGNQQSNTGNQQSNTGNQQGNTGNQLSNTGNQQSNTGNQQSNTGNQQNNAGNQQSNTGNQQSNTGNQVSDGGSENVGTANQQNGIVYNSNQPIDTGYQSGIDDQQDRSNGNAIRAQAQMGSIFVRWGRKECPVLISELVYSGFTGGSHHTHSGGAAEYICLPPDPTWNANKHFKSLHWGFMYGTEYDSVPKPIKDYKVPCAVCRTSQFSTTLMIPARTECYQGWQKAYHGDLVSGYYKHQAASQYVCLDDKPYANSSINDYDGKLMYSVKSKCGALPCPPYEENALLTCVVCLK